MSVSPTPLTSTPLLGGAAHAAAGDCHSCMFVSDYAYPVYGRAGWTIIGYDIHCCYFDRRVTAVKGCAKHLTVGAAFLPHPLEH